MKLTTGIVAMAMMVGGAAVIAVFTAWELRLTRRPGGQPLEEVGERRDLAQIRHAAAHWVGLQDRDLWRRQQRSQAGVRADMA